MGGNYASSFIVARQEADGTCPRILSHNSAPTGRHPVNSSSCTLGPQAGRGSCWMTGPRGAGAQGFGKGRTCCEKGKAENRVLLQVWIIFVLCVGKVICGGGGGGSGI